MAATTLGRMMIDSALPPALRGQWGAEFDAKAARKLAQQLADNHPDEYAETLRRLQQVAHRASRDSDGYSVSLDELLPPPEVKALRQKLSDKLDAIRADESVSPDERDRRVLAAIQEGMPALKAAAMEAAKRRGGGLYKMIASGVKGKPDNLVAMMVGEGAYADALGRPVAIPVLRGYAEGQTPAQYWAGTYGTRSGLTQTKLGTAKGGYLCLAGDTLVRMADWSVKPIKDVVVGDVVLGASATTPPALSPVAVTGVFDNGVRDCYRYAFRRLAAGAAASVQSVTCTPDHKLLFEWYGRAAVKRVGDTFAPDAKDAFAYLAVRADEVVTAVTWDHEFVGRIPTYDIEVDHPDHLFVLANGLIVSNSKQLNAATHRLVVTAKDAEDYVHDPASPRGMPVAADDPDNEGALLAADVAGYKRNTPITPAMIAEFGRKGLGRILIRSPIVGGPEDGGLYAYDAGVRERGGVSPLGDNVGVGAANALCLAEDTPVLMVDGPPKQVKDVAVGDRVYGCDASGVVRPVRVLAVHDNGVRPCYEAVFRLGTGNSAADNLLSVTATADHRLLGMTRARLQDVTDLPEVVSMAAIGAQGTVSYAKLPTGYDDTGHRYEPFALGLGLVIGDGSYTGHKTNNGVKFSCYDPILLEETRAYFAALGCHLAQQTHGEYRISDDNHGKCRTGMPLRGIRNPLRKVLVAYGMWGQRSHTKSLPDTRDWDNKSVAELLGGLLATDGHVQTNPETGAVSVGFASSSKQLIDGVRWLLAIRFGVYSSAPCVSTKLDKDGKPYRDVYKIAVSSYENVRRLADVVQIPGVKRDRLLNGVRNWKPPLGRKERGRCRLATYQAVGDKRTYDLEVDHPDHLFVLANLIISHNSEPVTQSLLGCLAEGTLVRMADWSVKPIKDVAVGDMVLGVSATAPPAYRPVVVTAVFDNGTRECSRYSFRKSTTTLDVTCTPDHKVLFDWYRQASVRPVGSVFADEVKDAFAYIASEGGEPDTAIIWECESVGRIPTYDIEVDHPDHLFVLANGLIVSNSKHQGGVVGSSKTTGGFPRINATINIPKSFPGGATHAQLDGRVTAVEPAPQGGTFVTVGAQRHYVPSGFEPTVKVGDEVDAGDPVSDGVPNPAELVRHKGVGEGRLQFVHLMNEAIKSAGATAHRRNIELLARGLINHVRLTGEVGDGVPDDVVPYQTIEAKWQPRDGHRVVAPSAAVGKYVERPVLHHTIGTRLTKRMAADLQAHGVGKVTVHDDPPPFEPVMVRAQDVLSHDPDWMTKQLGSGLEKSFLTAAARGGVSDRAGTSFVPSLAEGLHFGAPGNKVIGRSPIPIKPPGGAP